MSYTEVTDINPVLVIFKYYCCSEGWEKLGLYEYYRAKSIAKQQKVEDIASGVRAKSRSVSPIVRPKSRSRSPLLNRKRYRR